MKLVAGVELPRTNDTMSRLEEPNYFPNGLLDFYASQTAPYFILEYNL